MNMDPLDSSINSQQWLQIHKRCDALADSIIRDLSEKGQFERSGQRQKANEVRRRIRQSTGEIDNDLRVLERSLKSMERDPVSYHIGQGEVLRRQTMLRELSDRCRRAKEEGSGNSNRPRKRGPIQESDATYGLDNHELVQEQEQMIKQQDDHLDEILHGVKSLKKLGHDINHELDQHATLLDEIDEEADRVDGKLKANTHRVEHVHQKSKGWAGCIIIALLMITIVVLLIV